MQPKAFEQLLHIENHLIEDTVFMKTGYTMQDFQFSAIKHGYSQQNAWKGFKDGLKAAD